MSDTSWERENSDFLGNRLPAEQVPSRIALTATVVPTRVAEGGTQALVVNPHPESWNSWMFPYGSLVIEQDLSGSAHTYQQLTDFVDKLLKENFADYSRLAFAGVKDMLGSSSVDIGSEAFYSNYSLKFSKSAGVYTVYLFAYHPAKFDDSYTLDVESTWIPLNGASADSILENQEFEGLRVADNVIVLLGNESATQSIR